MPLPLHYRLATTSSPHCKRRLVPIHTLLPLKYKAVLATTSDSSPASNWSYT